MNQYVGIYYTIYLSGAKAVIYVLQYVPETHDCDKTQDFMQWEIHYLWQYKYMLFQVPIPFDLCHCLGYWKQLGCNCE